MGSDADIVGGIIGFIGSVVNSINKNNTVKKIHAANNENLNIIYYEPSDIEAFFSDPEPFSHVLFSGGEENLRLRAAYRVAEIAHHQGFSIVLLHNSNHLMESFFHSKLPKNQLRIINQNNKIYDPFVNLNNTEICDLILSTAPDSINFKTNAKYYIDGLCDYLRKNGVAPYSEKLIKCPHDQLLDLANDKIKNPADATKIVSKIMSGESERANIEAYLNEFQKQSSQILASKQNLAQATNIKQAIQHNQFIMVDVVTNNNHLLINLLSQEINNLITNKQKILLILDEVSINNCKVLNKLIESNDTNLNIFISSKDVFASIFHSDEKSFSSFLGKTSKLIVSQHASSLSCNKWSEAFGNYDRIDISTTAGAHPSGNSFTTTQKNERRVKPEDINRLSNKDVIIMSQSNSFLQRTTIR